MRRVTLASEGTVAVKALDDDDSIPPATVTALRARLSQHPAFQRMIYQKQGRRLRGMIDRSHQPTPEVALYNKLKALAYWIS